MMGMRTLDSNDETDHHEASAARRAARPPARRRPLNDAAAGAERHRRDRGSASITLAEVDEQAHAAAGRHFGNVKLSQALYDARRAALDECRRTAHRPGRQGARHRGPALVEKEITSKVRRPTEADDQRVVSGEPGARAGRVARSGAGADQASLVQQRMPTTRASSISIGSRPRRPCASRSSRRGESSPRRDIRRGPGDAPIELIEFSDFQCPFCFRAYPTVEQVLATYGDRLHFVYRHFPLPNHPNARPAAEAAACAAEQGKFWAYHDDLFTDPEPARDDRPEDARRRRSGVDAEALQRLLRLRTNSRPRSIRTSRTARKPA